MGSKDNRAVYNTLINKYCIFVDTEGRLNKKGVSELSQVAIVVARLENKKLSLERSFNTYKVKKDRGVIRKIITEYIDGVYIGNGIGGDLLKIDRVCRTNFFNQVVKLDFTCSMLSGEMGNFLGGVERTGLPYLNKVLKTSRDAIIRSTQVLFNIKKGEKVHIHNAMYDVGLMVFIIDLYVDYVLDKKRYYKVIGDKLKEEYLKGLGDNKGSIIA